MIYYRGTHLARDCFSTRGSIRERAPKQICFKAVARARASREDRSLRAFIARIILYREYISTKGRFVCDALARRSLGEFREENFIRARDWKELSSCRALETDDMSGYHYI